MKLVMLIWFIISSCLIQEESVYYDNIVVVVDASGSMKTNMPGTGTPKIDVAKQTLKTVLSQTPDNTQIGVLVFGNVRNEWVYQLGLKDNARLVAAIDGIQDGGSTPLGTYIKKGADVLLQQRQKQLGYGSYKLLIVTDGEADGGTETSNMNSYTSEILSRGITVDVIGVAMQNNHSLEKLVGKRYRRADDTASLSSAVQDVIAEISQTDKHGTSQDFDLLTHLDPSLASTMLQALRKQPNHPIGTVAPSLGETKTSSVGNGATSPTLNFTAVLLGGTVLIGIIFVRKMFSIVR